MKRFTAVRFQFPFILILSCILFNVVNGQTSTDIKQLYTDVFITHQKAVIPNSNFSKPLEVTLKVFLLTITRFDEVDETLDTGVAILTTWNNDGISWNPSSYGNAESIVVSKTDIWTPKLVLLNSVETYEPLGENNDNLGTVLYNGSSSIFLGDLLSSKCKTNIYKFPFDTQTCVLSFVVWGLTHKEVTLTADPYPVDVTDPQENMNIILKYFGSRRHRNKRLIVVVPELEKIEKENVKYSTEMNITWKDVCDGLDTYMMVISYCIIIFINCLLFIIVTV
ncbi:unnamed protein product [Mytilus edulis]|uniref:Neurotransmitter-gated ion-channel ligand-binding domain-containing protein n=1 Tax=Mytilus edulis TaxID=6550 RepID=A0A8S3SHR9_MYTED|nr:unnamed protein product [Mytilus edulis]